jgi:hypothetical protein
MNEQSMQPYDRFYTLSFHSFQLAFPTIQIASCWRGFLVHGSQQKSEEKS